MKILVQKYGGSSLSNTNKIKLISKRVADRVKEGYKLVVVVSAMGNTTDQLINFSKQISVDPPPRELDMLLATGEQVTASLLATAINCLGYKARSMTAFQAGIKTTNDFTDARISQIDSVKLINLLNDHDVLVITGFQGVNDEGDLTTLGRGGSDTTAVALAASLSAPCQIYSDVDGIYSIDPKYYPTAKKRELVCYNEMIEMASLGAKVLSSRSVEIAKKFNVPIYCASSNSNERGSYVVSADQIIEEPLVTGLSVCKNQTQVTIYNLPLDSEIVFSIFNEVFKQNFNVDMISLIQTELNLHLSFTLLSSKKDSLNPALTNLCEQYSDSRIEFNEGYSKVSIVGIGMRSSTGVAQRLFKVLKPYHIKMVTTSEIKISCLVREEDTEKIVKCIAEEFDL